MAKKNRLTRLVAADMPTPVAFKPTPPHKDPYQVQRAISTLAEASQIRKNTPLMREVRKVTKDICR